MIRLLVALTILAPGLVAGAGLPLKVTVAKSSQPIELLEGWKLNVTVENISDKAVTLSQLKWLLPAQLVATRGKPPLQTGDDKTPFYTWDTEDFIKADIPLGPGESGTFQLIMPDASESTRWYLTPSILSWRYRQLPMTVQLFYSSDDKVGSISETIDVQFLTPFRTMVFGGILGALLAMIFYYLYLRLSVVNKFFAERNALKLSAPSGPDEVKTALSSLRLDLAAALKLSRPEHLRTAWLQMLTASVTVAIVLLLLASGNMAMLPISVTVNDFVGAAFMGLVAHKIGKVTFDAIFGEKPLSSPAEKPAPKVVVPALKAEWDTAKNAMRLSWIPADNEKERVKSYELVQLATATGEVSGGTVVKILKPGESLEYFTNTEQLPTAGNQAFFALVVQTPEGTQSVGKTLTVKRP